MCGFQMEEPNKPVERIMLSEMATIFIEIKKVTV